MPAPTGNEASQGVHRTLADKITFLFETVLREVTDAEHARDVAAADGDETIERRKRPWKNAEVATEVGCSPEYIGYIKDGQRPNPNIELVRGLARIFGVTVSYLVDEEDTSSIAEVEQRLAMQHRVYEQDEDQSLAERLNTLFDTVRPGGGEVEYTDQEVAEAVGCTEEDIRALRDGTAADVGVKRLRCLAKFFGAPVAYLVGDAEPNVVHADRQLAILRELREAGVLAMALRASKVKTSGAREQLAQMVETFIQMEAARPAQASTDLGENAEQAR
ncbi:hypothetical protein [Actinokineospora enzanensis]|uniref:hypothetical protein n=1 Tax=Actinokineospora enzanensis TaxID=155975 RepID=UPI0012EC5459|nr:hypothetical protein [Actinokineospora enzanensis]